MIELNNITRKYGKKTAVDRLSHHFDKNKVYGLLGIAGSGKTSILNIIAGFISINDGCVIIDNHDISKKPLEVKRLIGYLPETAPLYDNMTVTEYLYFVSELKKISRNERASELERVINEADINSISGKIIRKLSHYERQRVGLAQSLIGNPKILIFDEPMTGIDRKQLIDFKKIIKNVCNKHTVVISSQVFSQLSDICDEISVITSGKIILSDTPDSIKDKLGGCEELILTVVSKPEKAINILRKIESVNKAENIGKNDEGYHQIKITGTAFDGLMETVAVSMSENKITLVNIVQKDVNLEEIFLKTTSEK